MGAIIQTGTNPTMLKVVFKDTADKEDSPLMRKSTSGLAANTGSWRSPLRGTDLSQREARGSKKLEVWKRKERSEDLSYCHETETQDQGSPAASPGTSEVPHLYPTPPRANNPSSCRQAPPSRSPSACMPLTI
ncbi:uncharacterized protein LOC143672556 isoform X4 [Tamandua tetradactyla]|uniref:uncharacterized protein LOC143672556 isoform X4 n=1 Tax=Tamandua tetradactyla TaxID=48850 RepID=UPI004053B007